MASDIGDRFVTIVNGAETEAFLDMFTSTGFVDDWGRTFTGRKEIKRWSDDEFIGAAGQLTNVVVSSTDDATTVTGMWTSQRHTGPSRFVLFHAGTQLASMRITAA